MMMKMEYRKLNAEHDGRSFRIEEDNPDIGWYLYVSKDGQCTHDHLQDSLEKAKEQALRQYGVPKEAWIEEGN